MAQAETLLTKGEVLRVVNRYIGVSGGYLGNFSYRSHQEFYPEFCGLEIDTNKFPGTTRERFIAILCSRRTAQEQVSILKGILDRYRLGEWEIATEEMEQEIRGYIARLEGRPNSTSTSADAGEATRNGQRMLLKAYVELLAEFDAMLGMNNPQSRGYRLEVWLGRLFVANQLCLSRPFTRCDGAEQIDGAFVFDNWSYELECKWLKGKASTRDLDSLYSKLGRSGEGMRGLLVSVNGTSEEALDCLKRNPRKNIQIWDGYDLRRMLEEGVTMPDLLRAKRARLDFHAEPFYSIRDFLNA